MRTPLSKVHCPSCGYTGRQRRGILHRRPKGYCPRCDSIALEVGTSGRR